MGKNTDKKVQKVLAVEELEQMKHKQELKKKKLGSKKKPKNKIVTETKEFQRTTVILVVLFVVIGGIGIYFKIIQDDSDSASIQTPSTNFFGEGPKPDDNMLEPKTLSKKLPSKYTWRDNPLALANRFEIMGFFRAKKISVRIKDTKIDKREPGYIGLYTTGRYIGEKYRISPLKAMEISQEIYMNYAAMPGFVKAMRTLPLAGFPFVSFAYGMTALSAKTLAYNPMFYNKVSYLLHEISGQKSPLEKQALESGYYQWMQKPGMMKVPFFQDNPVYLNAANMIPHYTMNILQPSERNYENRFGGQVANMLDKLPFFKTPDGQVMMDYVILPMILQGERPQGMFGQPLWEKDAGLLKKVGYGARALGESLFPPVAGYLGLGTVAGVPPEKALPAIPLYRVRQLGYATKGKSSLGIPGKEPAMERTARVMAAMAGVPYYPVKLQYSEPRKK